MKNTCSFIILCLFSLAMAAQINTGGYGSSYISRQKSSSVFHSLFDTAKRLHRHSHSFCPHAPKSPTFVAFYDSAYYWEDYDSVTQKFVKQASEKEVDMEFNSRGDVLHFLGMQWNGTKWENEVKEFFTYNSAGFITSAYFAEWLGSSWGDKEKETYTYDAHNNLTSELQQDSLAAWTNEYLYTYTYDANNNMTGMVDQDWNGTAWDNEDKYSYTYDANNNLLSEIFQYGSGSEWYNEDEYLFTYNSANLRTDSLELDWYDTAWAKLYNFVMSYDNNNNRDSMLYEYYESYDSEWFNEDLYTYTYNAKHSVLTDSSWEWNGYSWYTPEYAYTYTYDTNNNCRSIVYTFYNGIQWENESRTLNAYNETDSLTSVLIQEGETTGWENSRVTDNYYDSYNIRQANAEKFYFYESSQIEDGDSSVWYFRVEAENGGTAANGNILIYPNPSNGNFTVILALADDNSLFQIYNDIGQKVYETTINSNQTTLNVDISNYPRGMYICRVLSPGGSLIAQGKVVNAK